MSKKIYYAPYMHESFGEEEIKAVVKSLKDGWLGGFGPYTIEFENQISSYFGKKHGLFVNSGSSACLLALASLDLEKGSEVLTPALTFSTTVAPILQLGLEPKFVDSELITYVPSVDSILSAISDKTKVIMIPNLIGNKPNWSLLKEHLTKINRSDIILIEDSADTITHTKDSDISTTSFYASHIITAGGMGGMVMFNDEKHLKRAMMYRDWGRIGDNLEDISSRFAHEVDGIPYDYKFLYGVLGYNMKCTEQSAAFGLVQFKRFKNYKEIRRKNIERYLLRLSQIEEIILPDDSIEPNWLAIPLQYNDRLSLLTFLEKNNIQTRVTFAGNITRHPAFRKHLKAFKNADIVMKNGFLLGAHHGMTTKDVDYVCDKIYEFFSKKK
jgi:CDP-6-deoxy-D-xylo-4-hexulose-3-dehydrase